MRKYKKKGQRKVSPTTSQKHAHEQVKAIAVYIITNIYLTSSS